MPDWFPQLIKYTFSIMSFEQQNIQTLGILSIVILAHFCTHQPLSNGILTESWLNSWDAFAACLCGCWVGCRKRWAMNMRYWIELISGQTNCAGAVSWTKMRSLHPSAHSNGILSWVTDITLFCFRFFGVKAKEGHWICFSCSTKVGENAKLCTWL